MMNFIILCFAFFGILDLSAANVHRFNWTTGWGNYDLDGMGLRPVITCNGEYPWPDIRVEKGDRVEILLNNGFTDANTTLHVHGVFMNGTSQMDGPPFLTQCPIGPGDSFLYNFTVNDNVGTYWYHSHTLGQYQDGFKGKFVIDDGENNKNFPYKYDKEMNLEVGEYYHKTAISLTPSFMNVFNPTGAEPIPQNLLLNNTRNVTWEVEPDTTYLLRLVNTGGFVSQYFWIEDHEMTVVEVDGVYVEKNVTDMIYITTAQRYAVLITTKNDTSKNFAIMQKFDDTMLDKIPDDLQLNATSYLTYNTSAPKPEQNLVDSLDYLDDFYLVPLNKEELLNNVDHRITLDLKMDNLDDGVNYAFFNNVTYTAPKVPTLMTVMSAGDQATDPTIYGSNTNPFVLEKGETVEIILNNNDSGKHPFHLHGHVFQAVWRDRPYDADLGEEPHPFSDDDVKSYPQYPMMRDTLYVNPQSNFAIRFRADNPGIWYFHCHIEWHMIQGLSIVLIEDPLSIQSTASQSLTDDSLRVCRNLGVPVEGNAAANTNYTDLVGQNVQKGFIPSGFTAKGIVALTFSCLAGTLGVIMIALYGLMDLKQPTEESLELIKQISTSDSLLSNDFMKK